MTASSSNFKRTFGLKLPLYIGKVIHDLTARIFWCWFRNCRIHWRLSCQKLDQLIQIFQCIDCDSIDQQRFGCIFPSDETGREALLLRRYNHRQDPTDTAALALQRQLGGKQTPMPPNPQ